MSRRRERDDPLVTAAKQGDADAWRELYRAHAGRLVLWLQHRSPVDAALSAEDLSHEAWVTAADKIQEFQGSGEEFGGWLFGIARNHAANARRRSGRRSTSPVEHNDLEPHVESVEGPDATVPGQDWVHRVLSRLSDRERDVMVCLEVIGMDIAGACAALGMSAVAVRVTRHRALKRLRGLLEAPDADDEPQRARSRRSDAPESDAGQSPAALPARRSADVHVRTP